LVSKIEEFIKQKKKEKPNKERFNLNAKRMNTKKNITKNIYIPRKKKRIKLDIIKDNKKL
jgi:hypothetical protein